jgi:hypothetical protein
VHSNYKLIFAYPDAGGLGGTQSSFLSSFLVMLTLLICVPLYEEQTEYSCSSAKAEARALQVQGQPGLYNKTLSQKTNLYEPYRANWRECQTSNKAHVASVF